MLLSGIRRGHRGGGYGEDDVDPWWWVPIGLAAWFLVGLAVALVLGPVLRRSSQARESPDHKLKDMEEMPDRHEPPRNERQAS